MIELVAIAVMAMGIFLLKRGRWPARVGATLHCSGCNYALTGIQSDRCPECGQVISSRNVVHGERHRKPGLTTLGLLLILLPIIVLAAHFSGALQNIEWYHYRPAAWVMQDLDAASSEKFDRAWMELQRRLADNSLSTAQQDALIERALRGKEPGGFGGYRHEMVDFLGQRYLDHRLSAAQATRFLDNAITMQLAVRPAIGVDDRVPFRLASIGRGPSRGWEMHVRELGMWVDDRRIEGTATEANWGFNQASLGTLEPQPPGKHTLRVALQVGAGRGDFRGMTGPLEQAHAVQLTACFQVTSGKPPLTWLTSPDAAVIRRCLVAQRFVRTPAPSPPLQGTIGVTDPPVNLAFDVFARAHGKEYPLDSLSSAVHNSIYDTAHADTLPPGDLRTIDVIFRSSERVAKQTVDLTQIWQGEIVIPDVPVAQPTPRQPDAPAAPRQ